MGLLDTIWAIILPMTVAPFYIFLLRQYMVGLPGDMIEAAQIDGAGTLRCFIHVVLPSASRFSARRWRSRLRIAGIWSSSR